MTDLLSLENRIGGIPWQGKHPNHFIENANSLDLCQWLNLKGMPQEKINQLRHEQLEKCYCIKNYFDVILGNRPKNLAKGRRSQNALDVENILNDPDEMRNLFERASAFEKASAIPKVNLPNPFPTVPLNFRPKDPVEELLRTVDATIEKKLIFFREEIRIQTTDAVQQVVTQLRPDIIKNIKSSLENETIEFKISEGVEKKIISLVQKTADEIVFQALRSNPRSTGRTGKQSPATAEQKEELEPELDFGIDLDREATHSPFVPVIDHKFYFDPFASRVVRKALTTDRHVYLHGPAGCGKTMLVEQVCALLSHGLFRINPHDGITREFFLGGIKLKNGETYFQDGALPTAMRNGLALLVDEFSFLPPNLAAILHPVLERNGKLFSPETGEILRASPGFCVLATDNTGGKGDSTGQFTGTEVQNTATLDRFDYSVIMDYLPQDKEYSMIADRFPE